jgi:3-methylcrotonyl-CoA carboxylase beta subunit
MGGEQAATVLATVRQDQLRKTGVAMSPEEVETFKDPIRKNYADHSGAVYSASRLWVDSVVDPTDTRGWLSLGLAMAAGSPKEETRFGVFRM